MCDRAIKRLTIIQLLLYDYDYFTGHGFTKIQKYDNNISQQ